MVGILARPQKEPSMSERFGTAFGNLAKGGTEAVLSHYTQKKQNEQENEAIKRLTGKDVSGLSPELKKAYFEEISKSSKPSEAHQTKIQNIKTGLGTIQEMKKLISSAGPSNFVEGLFGGETTKNRAKLEQYGRSLIPLVASGVSIRNEKEFEEYRKIITDPNARQSTLKGALEGLEDLLKRQAQEEEGPGGDQSLGLEGFQEPGNQMVRVKAPDGRILRIPKDQVNSAISAGGRVVR